MAVNPSPGNQKKTLSGWGLYPRRQCRIVRLSEPEEALQLLSQSEPLIPRGLGRSYGDASLAPIVLDTTALNRLLDFDPHSGLLYAEAGLSVDALLRWAVPRGWFLPVVPGTKFITLGGALASDIHGKNHHIAGTFSRHVEEIEILTSGPHIRVCGPHKDSELFWATAGGMGLTGLIMRIKLRLRRIESAYIVRTTFRAPNLEAILRLFDEHQSATYSVAWIDGTARGRSLGRSLLFIGEHAEAEKLPSRLKTKLLAPHDAPRMRIPFTLPSFVLNHFTVNLFNQIYYILSDRSGQSRLMHYDPYFFPLDAIYGWNKIYGPRGFLQYQFVVPRNATEALKEILERISRSGAGSFLAVLKLFGPYEGRYLHFPMPGYTLAMDFPNRPDVHALLDELDHLVLKAGGRLYLTKDARMKANSMEAQYPMLEAFRNIKNQADPAGLWQSFLSARLALTSHTHTTLPKCSQAL
jgi:FAD/FMN-containing dehydrogenase